MWVMLLGGVLVVGMSIAQFVIKKINFTPLIFGGVAVILLLGVSGFLSGASSALEAIATAPPDMKTQMTTAGLSSGINTFAFASILGVPVTMLGMVAAIVQTVRSKPIAGAGGDQ